MQMPSTVSHNFAQTPSVSLPRSTFDRSFGYKTTFFAGYLIPFMTDEVLPGDTFNVDVAAFMRMNTPIVSVMDNIKVDFHFFFVPNRLVWTNWEKFCGEQNNPGDSTSFLIPQISLSAGFTYNNGSLFDYFGLPTQVSNFSHSALPLRAFNLIYNEWYRDENLQNSIPVAMGDGPDLPADYLLRRRGKRYDYFTSALPWPQKGPAVSIPLGTSAPVLFNAASSTPSILRQSALPHTLPGTTTALQAAATSGNLQTASGTNMVLDLNGTHYADLTAASAATINSLRQAFAVQQFWETDARGGTRYIEKLLAHFGVRSSDARLQRPEFLGSKTIDVNFHSVVQTSATGADSDTPQGNISAFAVASGTGAGFVKSFEEHGYVIGIMSARADLNYQQQLDRKWSRRSQLDFYWPTFANLGEQAILNKEIYVSGVAATDDAVFGYQERFGEYRFATSMITGQFRSNFAQSLDVYHLAQEFGSTPALNTGFIEENPPMSRIMAVPSEPDFIADMFVTNRCTRVMPTYSIPGLRRF